MRLSETLLPEFEYEMANTRKTLERVPEDRFAWKPHEKSMAMGNLASHVANIPNWAVLMLSKDSIDIAPEGVPVKTPQAASREELLKIFDENVASAREAISGASDESLHGNWTLLANGKTIFTQPRLGVLRGMVLSHNIHHRAQLGLYLRLNDVPVPAIYGPSADENPMM
jgi:uncharacterized damage-inducible protein DinB